MAEKTPVVLVVLDGWGIEEAHEHNGIAHADTRNFDRLALEFPYTELEASGEAVGLPEGQMGNSEVGHTTIGAGTVVYQDLVRISKDAKDGKFAENVAIKQAIDHVNEHKSQLHIIGLLSPGGVHSHEDHFIEVIYAAKKLGVKHIVLHPILDGRDAAPTAGLAAMKRLEAVDDVTIATVMGRYYAMDRDNNWDRTDKAFNAIFDGKAHYYLNPNETPIQAIQRFYDEGTYDEHIEPIVLHHGEVCQACNDDYPGSEHFIADPLKVQTNDAIIFTNFRTDRTRQLSQRIMDNVQTHNLCFVTMTHYGNGVDSIIAYEPQDIMSTMASAIAEAGLTQAHIAETEKFPHATYFLNGGKEEPHENEEHVLIPSRKDVKTHDEAPEMKAKEICDAALERLATNDFIFINFANADMVGHTAKREAILTAVHTVDRELGRLTDAVLKQNGTLLVIADHGNAERMIDPETGEPHTAHTTNLVPCILITNNAKAKKLIKGGGLKDVAPTILSLLDVPKPESMTGQTLITK